MRLLVFNLATDVDDPVLGFTTRWIEALSTRVKSIHVITMRAGRLQVPENVHVYSAGKEKGYSEARRVVAFNQHLYRILREERIDVCFAHMITVFTVLGAPLLKAKRIPIVSWYAHPHAAWTLKLAHHLSDRVVTSLAAAYPYRQDKLTVVGQGIDTDLFTPDGTDPDAPATILCAGRLSPSKDHPTLLKAAAFLRDRCGSPFQVVIMGGPAGREGERYAATLRQLARTLQLEDVVRFEEPRPLSELAEWYRRCTVHVNLTPKGFGDKVALEAMSCTRPCLVANDGFRETLGAYAGRLLFAFGGAEDLAERLKWVLSLDGEERTSIGRYLRERVVRMHGLAQLADSLKSVFLDCVNSRQHRAVSPAAPRSLPEDTHSKGQ